MPPPLRPLWWTKPFYSPEEEGLLDSHVERKLADLEEPQRPKVDIMELVRQASK